MFAGCSDEVVDVMVSYGEQVGIAFQLADDVIDLSSASGQSGKTPGTDLREGVPTLPVLLVRRAALGGDASAQAVVALLDNDLAEDARLAEAVYALGEHPATVAARDEAARWARNAVAALAPLPEGPAKQALRQFAEAVVDRTR
jgi:heptaprenyl diphosphate synthase